MNPYTHRAHCLRREADINQGITLMTAVLHQKEGSARRVNNKGNHQPYTQQTGQLSQWARVHRYCLDEASDSSCCILEGH